MFKLKSQQHQFGDFTQRSIPSQFFLIGRGGWVQKKKKKIQGLFNQLNQLADILF